MPAKFDALMTRMHNAIEEHWGETFKIHPQSAASDYSVGAADPDRPVWGPQVGVYKGGSTSTKDGPGGGPAVSEDFKLEVQDANLPTYEVVEGDRIELLERDDTKWYKVAWVDSDETGLTTFHLTYDYKSRT